MFYIIPYRRQVIVYSCPRCGRRLHFFSLLPILKHEWRCGGCRKKISINSACIGRNWGNVFALWSLPLGLMLGELLAVGGFVLHAMRAHLPINPWDLLGCAFAGFMCMVVFALLIRIVGRIAGALYGGYISGRRPARRERSSDLRFRR